MNHDELLREIESRRLHPAQDITQFQTWEHKAKVANALRAVVELVKPDDSDEVYPENKLWKSIIIQAISKELN